MKNRTKLVVVLLDTDELGAFFPKWPNEISLAVCLLPTGEHHFIFFHVSETPVICGRLERMLKISKSELEISPKVDGYETRPMLFSDNQLIWSLISDTPEALEEAVDYADNYRYAVEEGLDLFQFWGIVGESRADTLDSHNIPAEPQAVDAVLSQKPHSALQPQDLGTATEDIEMAHASDVISHSLPSFLSANQAKPNPGYFCVAELKKIPPSVRKWTIYPEHDGFIVFEVSGNSGATLRIEQQEQLYVSKDITNLAIRNTVSATNPIRPIRLEIKADILPDSIRTGLGAQLNSASLQERGYFLYFELEESSNNTDTLVEKEFTNSRKAGHFAKPNINRSFISNLARVTRSPFNLTKPSIRTAALILLAIGVTGLLSDATAIGYLH